MRPERAPNDARTWTGIAVSRFRSGENSPRAFPTGLAAADEIEKAVRQIESAPLTWRPVEEDVRRYLVARFPYGVYYTVEHDTIVIWAVKHLHRHPDYWQECRD